MPVLAGAGLDGAPGPSTMAMAGFAVALVAVWLVVEDRRARLAWRELGLPIAAGLGFGCFHRDHHAARAAERCSGRWWRRAPRPCWC